MAIKSGHVQALDSATRRSDFEDAVQSFAMCDSSSDDADSDELDESHGFDHEKIAGLLSTGASRSDYFDSTPVVAQVVITTPGVERRVASPARPEEARRWRCYGAMCPQRRARRILGDAWRSTRDGRPSPRRPRGWEVAATRGRRPEAVAKGLSSARGRGEEPRRVGGPHAAHIHRRASHVAPLEAGHAP